MSSLEAGILILYFSNFSTEGWARRISLFSSRIFLVNQLIEPICQKNRLSSMLLNLPYSTGRVLIPLKHRGLLILLKLMGFFASVHVTTHHNSYSIFAFFPPDHVSPLNVKVLFG